MSKISKGKFNLQATQVLNKVEYDVLGNPVGLIESPTDQTSCNFGIDRLPRRGGCYKGDGIAYLSVAGIQITDTYSVSTGSGNPIISSNRIDIVNGTILFDLKIYRAGVLWAWFKCDENYDTTCYDSSGNGHHGVIVNTITVTPEENPNSIHQYQNEYSYHNEVGYSKSGSIFIPKNESIALPPFKDVLGNNLQFFGKVPGRAKFVESNCFQQQISACYMTVTGLLATDTVEVFGSSAVPTLSANRMDFVVGNKYYGISIFRSGVLWAYYPMCEYFTLDKNGYTYRYNDVSGNNRHAVIVNIAYSNFGKQNEYHYLQNGYTPLQFNGTWYTLSSSGVRLDNFNSFIAVGEMLSVDIKPFGATSVIYADSTQTNNCIYLDGNRKLNIIFNNVPLVFNLQLILATWNTLSIERLTDYDYKITLNGISETKTATVLPLATSVWNLIGRYTTHGYSWTQGFLGDMREFKIGTKVHIPNFYNPLDISGNNVKITQINMCSDTIFLKLLNSNLDINGDIPHFQQDTKSFLPSGCFLRQYQQPALIQADKTSGVWFDANAEPYDVAYETLTLQDPINEQIFIGNKDKTKKLGPISTHKVGLTAVQKRTERVVRNVVDDPLIEDPAFSHDVTVAAGDLTYSLYNAVGYTMNGIIDWGDGTTQSVNTTATQTITKTYSVAGIYTVKFTGTMEYIYPKIVSNVNVGKIVKINNWGNCGFRLVRFEDAVNNISIPSTPITGLNTTSLTLAYVFAGNIKLTGELPGDLFYNARVATTLQNAFTSCIGLTGQIPENLFRYCPNLTSVASVFQGCTGLTGQIPEELLKYNTNLTTVTNLFYNCSGLSGSIPENLLKYNVLLTNAVQLFENCNNLTGSISDQLLRYNTDLTVINNLFSGCSKLSGQIPQNLFLYNTKLVSMPTVFRNCALLTGAIPEDLFKYNILANGFENMFGGCICLTGTVPANLFRHNPLAGSFQNTFSGCTSLTNIPTDLFRYNTVTTSFDSTFFGCTGITSIPTGLFDYNTNVTTFTSTFRNTRITTIPSNLFTNNVKTTSFSYTFAANPSLAAIPSNLFDTNTLVTTFDNVFYGCTGITSIPTDLFRYNIAVTNMSGVFQGTRITSVPLNLFRYNTEVTLFANVFYALGKEIQLSFDIDIFRYNTKVTNMAGVFCGTGVNQLYADMFKYNVNVTSFDSLISGGRIYNGGIPANLFYYNTKVTIFSWAFSSCIGITDIPTDLFRYNTLATQFSGTLSSLPITSIPVDLFRYNTEVTIFRACFQVCVNLTTIPEDLFYYNTKVTSYTITFYGTRNLVLPTRLFNTANLGKVIDWSNFLNVTSTTYSPTGTIQKIWSTTEGGDVTYIVQPTKTDAFNNCTALSNYAEIPVAYI